MTVIHPDPNWLHNTLDHMHDEAWRGENIDDVARHLPMYFDNPLHIDFATAITLTFMNDLMDRTRYNDLSALLELALAGLAECTTCLKDDIEIRNHIVRVELVRGNVNRIHDMLEFIWKHINDETIDPKLRLDIFRNTLKYESLGYKISHHLDLVKATLQLASSMNLKEPEIYIDIAQYYYGIGDVKEIDNYFRSARRYIHANFPMERIARIHFQYAVNYRLFNQPEKAQYHLNIASKTFSNIGAHKEHVSLLYEKSQWFITMGDYSASLDWIDKAMKEFQNLTYKSPYLEAVLTHGRGLSLYYCERLPEAHQHLYDALKIWRGLNNEFNIALALNALAATETKLKQPESALRWLEMAREICTMLENVHYVTYLMPIIEENISDAQKLLATL